MKLNKLYELFYTERDRERKFYKMFLKIGVFLLISTFIILYIVGNSNNLLVVLTTILIVLMMLFLIIMGVHYINR